MKKSIELKWWLVWAILFVFPFSVKSKTFVHPGVLHTKERFEQIRSLVENKTEPAYGSYLLLKAHPFSQSDYKMRGPFEWIARDGQHRRTKDRMEADFSAVYQNALMWMLTKDKAHARKALEILTAYAHQLKGIPDTNDAPLLAGLEGFKIIYAMEVLKYSRSSMSEQEYRDIRDMFIRVFLPVLDTFYKRTPYTNGNWGAIVTKAYMAAAIHLDNAGMYEKAMAFYLKGKDNGTILHYIDGTTGQIQESGRDQSHCMLGLGALATVCELAWQQGDDLYAALDNRLMRGYEYVARYNLGYDVPFHTWKDITGKYCDWTEISEKARGRYMYVFDIAYNHYVNRKGYAMPYTRSVLDQIRPEGYDRDQPAFGTLLFNESELPRPFVHPGGLHTMADLDRMKSMVAKGEHPWIEGWNELLKDPLAQNTFVSKAFSNLGRSRQRASIEAHAVYLNTIRWYISGDESYAKCAIDICNAWSSVVDQVPTKIEESGLDAIPIAEFAMAAEILRISDLWKKEDFERFCRMMRTYWYPVCRDFLRYHNGANVDYYWTNWDACNMMALVSIGILCDDRQIYEEGINYYKNGLGNGNIRNAVPYLHRMPDGSVWGQWQESGRDQEHAQLGVGFMASICQMVWNQGEDLYAYDHNRLLAGAEYVAAHNQMRPVPFTAYDNSQSLQNYWGSVNGLGSLGGRPIWEMIYNHYEVLKGIPAPNSKRMAELLRPEHGSKDHFGYGTLTFTLKPSNYPPLPVPEVPQELKATPAAGKIYLEWQPSAGYFASGYCIQRADKGTEDYVTIAEFDEKIMTNYTDRTVEAGKAYTYRVAAVNKTGQSRFSETVTAAPFQTEPLSADWNLTQIGGLDSTQVTFSPQNGQTFVIKAKQGAFGGTADKMPLVNQTVKGNFTMTCRILDVSGAYHEIGILARPSMKEQARSVSLTLGHWGGRFARMGWRKSEGEAMKFVDGNSYTWVPAWFKLVRCGDVFYAYQSCDGDNWIFIHAEKVEMSDECMVGLTACFKTDNERNKVEFDHVMLTHNP